MHAEVFEATPPLVRRARVIAEYLAEWRDRSPFWIAGVPTELDHRAMRKAVARRLNLSPDAVERDLAADPSEE